MKNKLKKEILDITKQIKNEQKIRTELNNELIKYEKEIQSINNKIKNSSEFNNNNSKLSKLEKFYKLIIQRNKEKTTIEYNYDNYFSENKTKEQEYQKNYKNLLLKKNENEKLISKKIIELKNEKGRKKIGKKKLEHYIIPPEMTSMHMFSKIPAEIHFMEIIRNQTKNIKEENEKILKEIETQIRVYNLLKTKKDSSIMAELSTDKNSPQYIFQQLDNINNKNEVKGNYNSSLSIELDSNINMDNLPSEDESLKFIDKVFSPTKNIKPIKNKYNSIANSSMKISTNKNDKMAEPIKIKRYIDYKTGGEEIQKKIDVLKKEIETKKIKYKEIYDKRKTIEEEFKEQEKHLKHAFTKIKIIQDQINVIQKQIEEINNSQNNEYVRKYSYINIINNKYYYLSDINNVNNKSEVDTFRI